MPPTSKKLKGQIGLGLFICPSIYSHPPPLPHPLLPQKKFYYRFRLLEKERKFTYSSSPPTLQKKKLFFFRFGFIIKKNLLTPAPITPLPDPKKKKFILDFDSLNLAPPPPPKKYYFKPPPKKKIIIFNFDS